jgi:hypothetical protein
MMVSRQNAEKALARPIKNWHKAAILTQKVNM